MNKLIDIDDEAELLGINKELWETYKGSPERDLPNNREQPLERELPPPRIEQLEFESITAPIDDREAFIRHKQSMTKRWFGYYKSCKYKEKKMSLIDSYNIIARQRQR